MGKYGVQWESVWEENEDYGEWDSALFNTYQECLDWLGEKDKMPDYYCVVWEIATGRVVHLGWMP